MSRTLTLWGAALVLALTACGPGSNGSPTNPDPPPPEPPPVTRVGVLLPTSGNLKEYGAALENGIRLAVKQLNAAAVGTFGGPIIELISGDSGETPSQSASEARRLVEAAGVAAIIGPLTVVEVLSVAEQVTIPEGVVQLVPASTSPLITELPDAHGFIFRTVGSEALEGMVAAQLARGQIVPDNAHATAAILYADNAPGRAVASTFEAAFTARGGTITAKVAHPDSAAATYAAALDELLAGNPDVALAASYPGQAAVYMAEALELHGFSQWQLTSGTLTPEIISAVGGENLEGTYGTLPANSDPEWAGWNALVESYEEEYGERPRVDYVSSAYDAAAVLGLAIAKAVVDDVEVSSENVRARLRTVANPPGEKAGVNDFERALRLIKDGVQVDFSGAAGEVDFDEFGDVVTPYGAWEYRDGEFVPVAVVREIPAE